VANCTTCGAAPDFHRRDLWNAIQSGDFPEWDLCVQLFDQECADQFEFDVRGPTRLIPEEILAPIPVGRPVLARMQDNFFAQTEQVGSVRGKTRCAAFPNWSRATRCGCGRKALPTITTRRGVLHRKSAA